MANKDAMRRFYEEIVRRNLGVIDELLAEDFVEHDRSRPSPPVRARGSSSPWP
jgi:ketosteroid isomerase-like protein